MIINDHNYYLIASYPKSGNTWCRLFIKELINITNLSIKSPKISKKHKDVELLNLNSNLSTGAIISNRRWFDDQIGIDSIELTEYEIDQLRLRVNNQKCSFSDTLRFHKVHDAFSKKDCIDKPNISTKNCLGVLYLIRNPADIIASMESFFGWSRQNCFDFIINPDAILGIHKNAYTDQISQYLGTWEHHVNSWTRQNTVPKITIRYEDLILNPLINFNKIADFFEINCSKNEIKIANEKCNFKTLSKKEKENGFLEAPSNGNRFFRKGVVGDGLNKLNSSQINLLEETFKSTLKKYNYNLKDGIFY